MSTRVVSYRETLLIESFLRVLHYNYSSKINVKDSYLISAVAAWYWTETNFGKTIVGNNPFGLRGPTQTRIDITDSGQKRYVTYPGKLLRYATLAKGFEALAYVLMAGSKSSGYQLALNALKRGGNAAAADFLAAIAMSTFDAGRYGATDWLTAYDASKNQLLSAYTKIGGVQLLNPRQPRPKPVKPPPKLPRDLTYQPPSRTYLDPWAAGRSYRGRGKVDARARRA